MNAGTCHHPRVESSTAKPEPGCRSMPLQLRVGDACNWLRDQGMLGPR